MTVAAMAAMLLFTAAAALAQSEDGKATVCHKPGTPAGQTLAVDESALDAHLNHGDTEGACPEQATEERYEDEGALGQYADIGGQATTGAAADQYSDGSAAAGSQGNVQSSADLQYGGTSANIQNNTQINQTVSAEGDVNQNFFFGLVSDLFGGSGEGS